MNLKVLRSALLPVLILGTMGTAFAQELPKPTPSPTPDRLTVLQETATEIQVSVNGVSAKVDASALYLQQIQSLVNDLKSLTGQGFSQVSQKADQIQSSVNGAVTALRSLNALAQGIQAQATQLQGGVASLQTKLNATASTLDQLKQQVGENEARLVVREIEDQLRTNKYELKLFIPASQGGQLDLVKDIVSAAYDNTANTTHGSDSKWYLDNSKDHLESALAAFSDGVWGKAVDQFGKAYRDLIKANRFSKP